jgi:hypothetical protein
MSWTPRPLLGAWTPDQARIARHFPTSRRVACTAANGVGKTHLAADLAVSFLLDCEAGYLLTTAPTKRQVETLLWPQIWRRLRDAGLPTEGHARAEYFGADGDYALGFATNKAERAQGHHAPQMLCIVDEGSGVSNEIFEALEGCAVDPQNYIFVIGNPNQPIGPFYELSHNPNWENEQLSALTHPNILERRQVIGGATSFLAFCDHLTDWCRCVDQHTEETFDFDGKIYLPNDAFRVRFLGLYPRQAATAIFGGTALLESTSRVVAAEGKCTASLDVARTGGDRTVYGLRRGNAVVRLRILRPDTLPNQAQEVARLLHEDQPSHITIDAAGLGIGLIDDLRLLVGADGMLPMPIGIREFQGSGEPLNPNDLRRYFNRRAVAYAHLATGITKGLISLPAETELLEELARITVKHKADGRLIIASKDDLKAQGYRSPDLADAVSMLFEMPAESAFQQWIASPMPAYQEL